MSLFARKLDPIESQRLRLEAELRALEKKAQALREGRARPTPRPSELRATPSTPTPQTRHAAQAELPRLRSPLAAAPEPPGVTPRTPAPLNTYSENGVRRLDMPSLWRRFTRYFHGPNTTSPRIVTMLATGTLHGPRPLRIERKIARRRSLALFFVLVVVLGGILNVIFRTR
jgi:hypothetical protein